MKISNLPKTTKPTSSDLLTIVQGGKVKNISVSDLTKSLVEDRVKLAAELRALKKEISKNTLNKNNPILDKNLKVPTPKVGGDASNKSYVDTTVSHLIKTDGSSKISAPLSYDNVSNFSSDDLISKQYADSLLVSTLKVVKELDGSMYPKAFAGDTYISMKEYTAFASNGPSLQVGDIIICTSDSVGGTHGEVGTQFALINTNVVFSTEDVAGILKVASKVDAQELTNTTSAMSPKSIRDVLESSSVYNRKLIDFNSYAAKEEDRGIIAVDSRRGSVEITLPSVSSLVNPKLVKFVVKDEFGHANSNNITVKCGSGNLIDSIATVSLNQKYQAISIYNDGKNYYIESNTHNKREDSAVLISAGKAYPTTTAVDDIVYSFELDLAAFDVNEGISVECYGDFIDTTSNIAKIKIDDIAVISTGAVTSVGGFQLNASIVKTSDGTGQYSGRINVDGSSEDISNGSIGLNSWSGVVTVSATLNCATATNDANIVMFIVKPLK